MIIGLCERYVKEELKIEKELADHIVGSYVCDVGNLYGSDCGFERAASQL